MLPQTIYDGAQYLKRQIGWFWRAGYKNFDDSVSQLSLRNRSYGHTRGTQLALFVLGQWCDSSREKFGKRKHDVPRSRGIITEEQKNQAYFGIISRSELTYTLFAQFSQIMKLPLTLCWFLSFSLASHGRSITRSLAMDPLWLYTFPYWLW